MPFLFRNVTNKYVSLMYWIIGDTLGCVLHWDVHCIIGDALGCVLHHW